MSIATQDTAGPGGRASVLVRQKADHARLHELLQALGPVSTRMEAATLAGQLGLLGQEPEATGTSG